MDESSAFEWIVTGEVLREHLGDHPEVQASRGQDPARLTGRRLGQRFQVGKLLGRGGMGAVYRARDLASGRDVALKVLLPGTGSEASRALQRFQREARLTAELRHPGIVGVHSAGELDGRSFIAYELVEGARPLDQAARDRPLEERVALVRDAARALAHAHEGGVIHRDVKPENLLVDAAGRLRVSDFGLGRAEDARSRISLQGALMGTPLYMSPEGLRGAELDARADVWALGVVLYLVVAGEHPFGGRSLTELGLHVLAGSPRRLRDLVPGLGRELDDVCARALARLDARYPDAGALAEDLDAWLGGARPGASFPRHRAAHATVFALGAVGLAGAWLTFAVPSPGEPDLATVSTATVAVRGSTPPPALPGPPAWWSRLPERRRSPATLPSGLEWGQAEREVINRKDGSSLRWIPAAGRVPGFFLGTYEVTWKQWEAFSVAVGKPSPDPSGSLARADEAPVAEVTLAEAREYCVWAGLRLPREEEWLLAAHPDGALFPWGNDPDPSRANLGGPTDPWTAVSPVGSFPRGASPEGVHDLVGNVFEWVESEPNPLGIHPILGGCMSNPIETLRSGVIDRRRMGSLGFRVAR